MGPKGWRTACSASFLTGNVGAPVVSRLRVKLTVLELPFRVAVTTAGGQAVHGAGGEHDRNAGGSRSHQEEEAGDAKRLLLLLRLTAVPPVGADCEMATVHVVEAPEPSDVDSQAKEVSVGGGISVRLAVSELPLRVAVKTAVWATEIVPAVSATAAVVAPADTVSEDGEARTLLLLLRLTTAPPVGAASESAALEEQQPPKRALLDCRSKSCKQARD